MSAVLLRVCDLDTIRDDLRALARSDYWHTTELAQSETGWTRIQEMLDYLARYRDICGPVRRGHAEEHACDMSARFNDGTGAEGPRRADHVGPRLDGCA